MIKLRSIVNEILNEDIPQYLYHSTFNALIPHIKKEGLVPRGKMFKNFEDIEWGVYLANDENFAGSMAQATENKNIPDKWFDEIVICVIDTTGLDKSQFDVDPNVNFDNEYDDSKIEVTIKSYIYKGIIPPATITEIVDYKG